MAMTKREKAIKAAVVPGKAYAFDEAIKIIKSATKAKFVESVDVAVRLGVDAKKSDQQVRGSTVLPAGTGKSVRVAVFAPAGAKADEALAAGAEAVGMDDLAEKILTAIKNRGSLQRIGEVARKTAEEKADWKKNSAALMSIYRSLITKR